MKTLISRYAMPEDWLAIQVHHARQCDLWETNYELPNFWQPNGNLMPNIEVVIVAVDENDFVHECFYVERTAELRFVGCDAKATAHLRRESEGLAYILKKKGYRWLECFVPRVSLRKHWWEVWKRDTLVKIIRKPLEKAGFCATGSKLAHFTKDLREGPR